MLSSDPGSDDKLEFLPALRLFAVLTFATQLACFTGGDFGDSSTGEDCPVGLEGCPCTPGGACVPGLVCALEVCASGPGQAPPAMVELSLSPEPIKTFAFSWPMADGATDYRLLEGLSPEDEYDELASEITETSYSGIVGLHARSQASYQLLACNDGGCTASPPVAILGTLAHAVGYVKATNPDPDDQFGRSIALSADGKTLAVGASAEDSGQTGVDPEPGDNSSSEVGAVYVYTRDQDGGWSLDAYIKPSITSPSARFGASVSLSDDGATLAVGAPQTGQPDTGEAFVYRRDPGGAWTEEDYLLAPNGDTQDLFGGAVALSGDGSVLAVGAEGEDSDATGVNGDMNSDLASFAGAAYIYTRDTDGWSNSDYIKASNTGSYDHFGVALSLNAAGDTLAVAATGEDSGVTGINGEQSDNSRESSGAVYIYKQRASGWTQVAYVKASNTDSNDRFGYDLDLDAEGTRLVVSAPGEDSSSTQIDMNSGDNEDPDAGAAYVFNWTAENGWNQEAYLKPSNDSPQSQFGTSVALQADGWGLVGGAAYDDIAGAGVNDPQRGTSLDSGAAFYFTRDEMGQWKQVARLKASNADSGDKFGSRVAVSADGSTLAVSAHTEDGSSEGVGGDQEDNSKESAGAVYLF